MHDIYRKSPDNRALIRLAADQLPSLKFCFSMFRILCQFNHFAQIKMSKCHRVYEWYTTGTRVSFKMKPQHQSASTICLLYSFRFSLDTLFIEFDFIAMISVAIVRIINVAPETQYAVRFSFNFDRMPQHFRLKLERKTKANSFGESI